MNIIIIKITIINNIVIININITTISFTKANVCKIFEAAPQVPAPFKIEKQAPWISQRFTTPTNPFSVSDSNEEKGTPSHTQYLANWDAQHLGTPTHKDEQRRQQECAILLDEQRSVHHIDSASN